MKIISNDVKSYKYSVDKNIHADMGYSLATMPIIEKISSRIYVIDTCVSSDLSFRTRSLPKMTANWLSAIPQSRIGIVHFSGAFRIAKYNILNIASSFGNAERFFVTFRSG
jgi:hypothetical protein